MVQEKWFGLGLKREERNINRLKKIYIYIYIYICEQWTITWITPVNSTQEKKRRKKEKKQRKREPYAQCASTLKTP